MDAATVPLADMASLTARLFDGTAILASPQAGYYKIIVITLPSAAATFLPTILDFARILLARWRR